MTALILFLLFARSDAAEAYRLGVSLFEQHRAVEAVPHLEDAVHLEPKNAQYQKALGVALASLDRTRESVEPLGQACALQRDLVDACYYYGRALYATDRYADALRPLETAWKVDAVKGRAETALAQCAEALGQAAEAERRFKAAIARGDAADRTARLAYGKFLVRQARAGEGVSMLESAQSPETSDSRYELGFALAQCDRLKDAAESLARALQLEPSNGSARVLLDKINRRMRSQ